MKRRDKWILIGCLACVIAVIACLGYFVVWWVMRDLNRMEARRPVLLYETDHRALLEACRELSREVATEKLEPGIYVRGDPERRQFPQLIQDLTPVRVEIDEDGEIDLMMSAVVLYGVRAFPEGYDGPLHELYRYGDNLWGIELVDGLWYYDEAFQKHPEQRRTVEELLKKRE